MAGPRSQDPTVVKGLVVALTLWNFHLSGCQNYGPFWGPSYNTAPII